MANSDRIQEVPATPLIELEHALAKWAEGNVAALAVLSKIEDDSSSFEEFFCALNAVFAFDRALVLEAIEDGLHCLAAEPKTLVGRQWPEASLRDALHVQALPAGSASDAHRPQFLSGLAGFEEPVLCLPIGVNGRPALLVLLRPQGAKNFDAGHIAVASQCATIALATLIARKGKQFEAEIQRLNARIEQTEQNSRLLKGIVDHLPISLTVQDDSGRFILANAMAAANLAIAPETLIGSCPADFLPEQEAASRREWEENLIRQNKAVCAESQVLDGKIARTWLTSHNPVRIVDQKLLISSSVDITEYKQAERELVERAHIDKLTGLPDRILIQEHVEAIIRNDDGTSHFALAFIDLDNFKHINDYYNHAVGDGLLVKIGQRVSNRLRPGDMLARISGDEFLMLLQLFDGEKQARPIIDEILNDLKQPFYIDAFEVFSSCSIGVSLYPEHGRTYDELRRNADNAMYRAKHAAKGDAIIFDLNIAQAVTARMEVEQRLRLAIRDRKFCCAFQPKVNIHTQQVVGFETLVRWRDDDGEIHPPGEFIELAVELGLINSITSFVLTEAVNSIERLDVAFGPDTTISINVAAKQANDVEFMRSFTKALIDTKRADRIIIELTEDAFIAKGAFQTKILPLLREIGVRVSIDDFGTGYSSLSALADITADEIKIDRSFISAIHERPRNQSVLRAIESLGHALDMTIVAEGVETYEELTYLLAATRIRYVQGFYFSKPIYLEDGSGAHNFELTNRPPETERARSEAHGAAASRVITPARARG